MSDWRDEASCIGIPHVFEPDDRGGTHDWRTPRAICAGCPVRQACLDDALAHEAVSAARRWGMRGGLTPAERSKAARDTTTPLAIVDPTDPARRFVSTWDPRCGTLAGEARHRRRRETACDDCLRATREYAKATRKSRAKAVAS